MTELFSKLFEPFPDSVKTTKTIKGSKITFVEWYQYIVRAWKTFPQGFSTRIVSVHEIGKVWGSKDEKGEEEINDDRQLILVVEVQDHATGIVHQGTGTAPVRKEKAMFGGATAEAESQGLRRAFAKFGLGLEMYMDEEDKEEVNTSATKEQLKYIKLLVDSIPAEHELQKLVESSRKVVKNAVDKQARTEEVINTLIEGMKAAGLEVPVPS